MLLEIEMISISSKLLSVRLLYDSVTIAQMCNVPELQQLVTVELGGVSIVAE